jgi:hypothetical protein
MPGELLLLDRGLKGFPSMIFGTMFLALAAVWAILLLRGERTDEWLGAGLVAAVGALALVVGIAYRKEAA